MRSGTRLETRSDGVDLFVREVTNLDCSRWTAGRTASAGLAHGAVDLADMLFMVDLDRSVGAHRQAGAASRAELRLNLGVHRIDRNLSLRHLRQDACHRRTTLHNRIGDILGELAGTSNINSVRSGGDRIEFGMAFDKPSLLIPADVHQVCNLF